MLALAQDRGLSPAKRLLEDRGHLPRGARPAPSGVAGRFRRRAPTPVCDGQAAAATGIIIVLTVGVFKRMCCMARLIILWLG